MTELPKTFDPAAIEQRWYQHWESNGLFRPERPDAQPWTIVNPPPNVTGSLHIGHALDNTLQDVMTRYERMRGKDALWVVGMDHAGIATQMVVERNLEAAQDKRTNYSRDAFIAKVWEWKEESGGQITGQLRRLGCSMDWANERFTMDEGFTRAVLKVFVQLYREGLLYRDKRLVNWDPKFRSAISDLEVETREVQGKFWTLRYPLADGSGHLTVATTRPETMLADMAVAAHPEDERYARLIGAQLRLPITGRLVPIIADEHADPELGSGAVKITPGHDFNDFEVGKRAGMQPRDMLNMLDPEARVAQTADGLIPEALIGLDRFEARKRVVEMLEADGALERVEDRTIQLPFGDRSGVVIEPWLTDQWYVDAATLARPAIEAARTGKIEIVPRTWEKTWFNWLENIQPWCVSRQLWWGHRIPAWYGVEFEPSSASADSSWGLNQKGIKTFVAESEEDVREQALAYVREIGLTGAPGTEQSTPIVESEAEALDLWMKGECYPLWRDQDVLDTWFSSALWPFATLGWPEPTEELKRHYPNDLLISGFDIIFFWDARMAMQGIHFMGDVPWRRLYLHGLVRDSQGQKMSKSKGNTVDPLGLIDRYGADALRFTLAAMESQGRDIKLDEKRVEGYRNFATKLWNAARFLQINGVGASESIAAPDARLPVNRWIIGEVVETLTRLDRAYDELRFDEMADTIYHFTWGTFCDWYVELVKGELTPASVRAEPVEAPSLSSDDEQESAALRQAQGERLEETRKVAAWAFDQILVMLHPLMPFITEELWNANERPYELIVAKWPEPEAEVDAAAKADIEWLIELVSEVRTVRSELNVPWSATLDPLVLASPPTAERINRAQATVARLAKLGPAKLADSAPVGSAQIVVSGETIAFQLTGHIDLEAEKARLAKAAAAAEKERDGLEARLSNPNFTERAKPEAVDKARADHAEKSAEAERYRAALERLG